MMCTSVTRSIPVCLSVGTAPEFCESGITSDQRCYFCGRLALARTLARLVRQVDSDHDHQWRVKGKEYLRFIYRTGSWMIPPESACTNKRISPHRAIIFLAER